MAKNPFYTLEVYHGSSWRFCTSGPAEALRGCLGCLPVHCPQTHPAPARNSVVRHPAVVGMPAQPSPAKVLRALVHHCAGPRPVVHPLTAAPGPSQPVRVGCKAVVWSVHVTCPLLRVPSVECCEVCKAGDTGSAVLAKPEEKWGGRSLLQCGGGTPTSVLGVHSLSPTRRKREPRRRSLLGGHAPQAPRGQRAAWVRAGPGAGRAGCVVRCRPRRWARGVHSAVSCLLCFSGSSPPPPAPLLPRVWPRAVPTYGPYGRFCSQSARLSCTSVLVPVTSMCVSQAPSLCPRPLPPRHPWAAEPRALASKGCPP